MPVPVITFKETPERFIVFKASDDSSPTSSSFQRVRAIKYASVWHEESSHISPEDIEVDQGWTCSNPRVQKVTMRATGRLLAHTTLRSDDKSDQERMLNDISHLACMEQCPNLAQYFGGLTLEPLGSHPVYALSEFMDLGSVEDLIKRCGDGLSVPPDIVACIARQTLMGLDHLHSKQLLHGDLNPHHVFHDSKGWVKLTHFGITRDWGRAPSMRTYLSPELWQGDDYSSAVEVWSAGMMLHEVAAGRHPFQDVAVFHELFDRMCNAPEPRLDPHAFPPAMCDFLAQCLTRALRPEDGRPKEPAVPEPQVPAHVVVQNLAGEPVFGPSKLDPPLRPRDLARLIWKSGKVQQRRAILVFGGEVLPEEEFIQGGDAEEPSLLTLVLRSRPSGAFRAEADELLGHPFLNGHGSSREEFADWLQQLSCRGPRA